MDQLNNIAENEVTATPKQPKIKQTSTARQKMAWAPLPPGEVHNDDDDDGILKYLQCDIKSSNCTHLHVMAFFSK